MTFRYTGPVGKSFKGDRKKAVSYMGAARVLCQQLIGWAKAPPFNGVGQQYGFRRMQDGSTIHAMVNMVGLVPVVRTLIESPFSGRAGIKGKSYSLVYVLFNADTLLSEIYRVTIYADNSKKLLKDKTPFAFYDVSAGVQHTYTLEFDHAEITPDEENVPLVGMNPWVGPNKEIVTVYNNYILLNGDVIHDAGEDLVVAAAALDLEFPYGIIDKPRLVAQSDFLTDYWIDTKKATPGVFYFSQDARAVTCFSVSGLAYGAFRPDTDREFNGVLRGGFLNQVDTEKNLTSTFAVGHFDIAGATEEVVRDPDSVPPIGTLQNQVDVTYTYKLICGLTPVGRVSSLGVAVEVIDFTYRFKRSESDWAAALWFMYKGEKHVVFDVDYAFTTEATASGIGYASTYKLTVSRGMGVFQLGSETHTYANSVEPTEELYDRTLNIFGPNGPVAAIENVAPASLEDWPRRVRPMSPFGQQIPLVNPLPFEYVVYGAVDEEEKVARYIFRPMIEKMFNVPYRSSWDTSISPGAPVFRDYIEKNEDGEDEHYYFAVIPYEADYVVITDTKIVEHRSVSIEEGYVSGLSSNTAITYKTTAGKEYARRES
jgi:hypothetical protein